ncbi:MAG: Abi family protein [Polaribacter sp.]
MKYTKPPISFNDQIITLKQKGLAFKNEKTSRVFLENISYYRLRAYTYPFQDNKNPNHPFIKKISFEEIIDLYNFDSKLRTLVFDALEKIEIAFRTQIIYRWSMENGSHWYTNPSLFRNSVYFAKTISSLEKEIKRSHETFIKHYKQKYSDPELPPSWMSLEVSSLGLLSKLFANLKRNEQKKEITHHFGLYKVELLENWMRSFCDIRNICAHHSRLWNRRFSTHIDLPKKTKNNFISNKNVYTNKLYPTLCAMQYILEIINPKNGFKSKLLNLISSCPLKQEKEMGFPKNWIQEKIWK